MILLQITTNTTSCSIGSLPTTTLAASTAAIAGTNAADTATAAASGQCSRGGGCSLCGHIGDSLEQGLGRRRTQTPPQVEAPGRFVRWAVLCGQRVWARMVVGDDRCGLRDTGGPCIPDLRQWLLLRS